MRLLFILISLFTWLSVTVAKRQKVRYPLYLHSSKELDNTQLIRNLLVISSLPFMEVRFTKESEAKRIFFEKVKSRGYLTPEIPMLSDPEVFMSYIGTEEAITQYLLLSYYKELFPRTTGEYVVSIQANSLIRSYIKKTTSILEKSGTLLCEKLIDIRNMKYLLSNLSDKYNDSKYEFLYGDKYTFIDVSIYTLILFIENVSPGCVIGRYFPLAKFAYKFAHIPQISRYEKGPYFSSLIVPGTRLFAKPINFGLCSKTFRILADLA